MSCVSCDYRAAAECNGYCRRCYRRVYPTRVAYCSHQRDLRRGVNGSPLICRNPPAPGETLCGIHLRQAMPSNNLTLEICRRMGLI